jgi:replication factor C subunit 1
MIPLLIQENYLNAMGDRRSGQDLDSMAAASDYISLGDSISVQLRTNQDWSLLPNLGLASALAPALLIEGSTFYPRFPEWLGKNSSSRKAKRLIRELKTSMGYNAQASRMEIQNEYVDLILNVIYREIKNGKDGVPEAVSIMVDLGISNEVLKEHLMQLSMDLKLT